MLKGGQRQNRKKQWQETTDSLSCLADYEHNHHETAPSTSSSFFTLMSMMDEEQQAQKQQQDDKGNHVVMDSLGGFSSSQRRPRKQAPKHSKRQQQQQKQPKTTTRQPLSSLVESTTIHGDNHNDNNSSCSSSSSLEGDVLTSLTRLSLDPKKIRRQKMIQNNNDKNGDKSNQKLQQQRHKGKLQRQQQQQQPPQDSLFSLVSEECNKENDSNNNPPPLDNNKAENVEDVVFGGLFAADTSSKRPHNQTKQTSRKRGASHHVVQEEETHQNSSDTSHTLMGGLLGHINQEQPRPKNTFKRKQPQPQPPTFSGPQSPPRRSISDMVLSPVPSSKLSSLLRSPTMMQANKRIDHKPTPLKITARLDEESVQENEPPPPMLENVNMEEEVLEATKVAQEVEAVDETNVQKVNDNDNGNHDHIDCASVEPSSAAEAAGDPEIVQTMDETSPSTKETKASTPVGRSIQPGSRCFSVEECGPFDFIRRQKKKTTSTAEKRPDPSPACQALDDMLVREQRELKPDPPAVSMLQVPVVVQSNIIKESIMRRDPTPCKKELEPIPQTISSAAEIDPGPLLLNNGGPKPLVTQSTDNIEPETSISLDRQEPAEIVRSDPTPQQHEVEEIPQEMETGPEPLAATSSVEDIELITSIDPAPCQEFPELGTDSTRQQQQQPKEDDLQAVDVTSSFHESKEDKSFHGSFHESKEESSGSLSNIDSSGSPASDGEAPVTFENLEDAAKGSCLQNDLVPQSSCPMQESEELDALDSSPRNDESEKRGDNFPGFEKNDADTETTGADHSKTEKEPEVKVQASAMDITEDGVSPSSALPAPQPQEVRPTRRNRQQPARFGNFASQEEVEKSMLRRKRKPKKQTRHRSRNATERPKRAQRHQKAERTEHSRIAEEGQNDSEAISESDESSQEETKPRKKDNVIDNDEENNSEDRMEWSEEEVSALRKAHSNVDPTATFFWDRVASLLDNRTAKECRTKWFSLVATPKLARSKNGKRPKATKRRQDDSEEDSDDHIDGLSSPESVSMDLDGSAVKLVPFTRNQPSAMVRPKVGNKTYLKGLKKAIRNEKKVPKKKKKSQQQRSRGFVSEVVRDGDIELKANMTPGGTLVVKQLSSPIQDEDDFWDEEFGFSD